MKQYRYKLTRQDMTTHGDTQWKVSEWKQTSGKGELCGEGWLHCYCNPVLAVLHNPIHAAVSDPRLWLVEVRGFNKCDGQIKEGWTEMRLVKEETIPQITLNQKIAYGILCSLEVYGKESYVEWAQNWLSGKDRSYKLARTIADAAYSAAAAAYADAAYSAAAAYDAAAAASAAADAAYAAASAAAANRQKELNLSLIASKAIALY